MDKDPTSSDDLTPETPATDPAPPPEEPEQIPEAEAESAKKEAKAEKVEKTKSTNKAAEDGTIEETEPTVEEKVDKNTEESETKPDEKTSVDLSTLQGFDFGTSWSETKPVGGGSRSSDRRFGKGRPPRGDRPERKDRRAFKPGGFHKAPGRGDREQGGRPARTAPGRKPYGRLEIPKKVVEVSFYPEDNGFNALCKALRSLTITFELFDIARTILEKDERFYMIIRPVDPKGVPDEEASLYVSETDGIPFLHEDASNQYALSDCLDHFFVSETKEVEPPSGSFSSIRKCGFTGELLGPQNFHRIKKIMADHHASRLSHMPYARFESRIESVTEEEVIAEWLEKMKTQTAYTLKVEYGEARSFEDGETARAFVKANLGDKLVREVKSVRVEGSQISKVKDGLLRANLEFAWERQKRFPLDTANLLRGRLRRQKIALYKKGSKGVSYVCAVKRRFRELNESFSDPIQALLTFLDTNPNTPVRDLSKKYLGFVTHAVEGEEPVVLTEEQQAKHKAMTMDFQWLLKEGYIAEYSNGTIFAHPPAGPGQGVVPPKAEKPAEAEAKKEPDKEVSDASSADEPVSEEAKAEVEEAPASQPESAADTVPEKSVEESKEEITDSSDSGDSEEANADAEEEPVAEQYDGEKTIATEPGAVETKDVEDTTSNEAVTVDTSDEEEAIDEKPLMIFLKRITLLWLNQKTPRILRVKENRMTRIRLKIRKAN